MRIAQSNSSLSRYNTSSSALRVGPMTSGAIVRRRGILRTCSRINASLRLLMPLRARPISPSKTEEGGSAAFQVLEALLVDLKLLVVGRQDLFVPRKLFGVEVNEGG